MNKIKTRIEKFYDRFLKKRRWHITFETPEGRLISGGNVSTKKKAKKIAPARLEFMKKHSDEHIRKMLNA